jgi:Fe-S-cluster-containing dehydrogenase component
MSLTRRNFLKAAAAGTAACGVGAPAAARENRTVSPDALGLLYDSTLCIGCKACVKGCKDANGMPPEFSTEKLWDTPLDLSGYTKTVIKMYEDGTSDHKDQERNGYAFVKKSCMHCVDPSCVSACPVSAMTKDAKTGIVSYDPSVCIGCRYCVTACPFGVPRFQYDTAFPKINKCELCRHLLADGKIPRCAEVCPTGATLYGKVADLKQEAERRLSLTAGESAKFSRKTVGSADVQERAAGKYIPRIYGETEMGGTQMMLLAGVPFAKLGYPDLPKESYASMTETVQGTVYHGMIAPVAVLGGLLYFVHKNTRHDGGEEE